MIPTAKEIFDKPYGVYHVPVPPAWTADTALVMVVDEECARLGDNAISAPPITTRREFQKALHEAEAENRRLRHDRE